jgi:hypothetical protein
LEAVVHWISQYFQTYSTHHSWILISTYNRDMSIFSKFILPLLCLPISKQFCYSVTLVIQPFHSFVSLLILLHFSSMLQPSFWCMKICHLLPQIDWLSLEIEILNWNCVWSKPLILFHHWWYYVMLTVLKLDECLWYYLHFYLLDWFLF